MTLNEEKIVRNIIREMVNENLDELFNEWNREKAWGKHKDKHHKPKRKKTKFKDFDKAKSDGDIKIKRHHHEDYDDDEESVDRDGKPGKESDQAMGRLKNRRSTVMNMLKNKFVDCAPYAYALWPDKDEDNARSQFYKCRDGEENDSGVRYSFTDQEINRLYSMITNNNG